ncbi:MAG: NAD kinase [Flavobacteriales bacterium]
MKFCIFGKRFDKNYIPHIKQLIEKLVERGFEVSVYNKFADFLNKHFSIPSDISQFSSAQEVVGADFLISIGGDGTLLDTASFIRDTNIPVLGINTGRLGFLSNVDVEEIDEALEALVSGKYYLDKRSLIEVKSNDYPFGDFPFALNDVTILNKERNSMISIHTQINDEYMSTYWADGLIISTPTGSTAYNLSCGGPIVTPDSNNIILTPIAPHNLNVRPLIMSNSNKVTLKVESRSPDFQLTIDSRSYAVKCDTVIELTCAPFEIGLVSLENQSFFNTIRNKMGWGMDKRN